MTDQRKERTQRAIKDALLRLMKHSPSARVGVSELAREAGVSRSSFYNHYAGVHEVLDALIDEFDAGNLTIFEVLRCDECGSGRLPFCVRLRNAGKLAPLVSDPAFLPALIMRIGSNRLGLGGMAQAEGLAPALASSLATFQLAGCYAAAMSLPHDEDWEPSRRAIDRFIGAGAPSFRNL